MSGFDLSNYKTVPERMTEALAKYPNGSLQSEIVELPTAYADKFMAVKARFFRTPDDPAPGEGMAWELVPGKTPYTKDSELMNAETSAWGRAIVAAFAADAQKGIASREEVEARQPAKRQTSTRATKPAPGTPEPGPDVELRKWVAKQKLRLVEAFDGDKEAAKDHWIGILVSNQLESDDQIPTVMWRAIEDDVDSIILDNLPDDQKPFAETLL